MGRRKRKPTGPWTEPGLDPEMAEFEYGRFVGELVYDDFNSPEFTARLRGLFTKVCGIAYVQDAGPLIYGIVCGDAQPSRKGTATFWARYCGDWKLTDDFLNGVLSRLSEIYNGWNLR